jgi:GDPmannose 4,6-dehydratase
MLQQQKADDFVISTGESHTVREFVSKAFELVELDWQDYVIVDPELYRPAEVDFLRGDSSKAETVLNWKPSISFEELVKDMVSFDVKLYEKL